jgi:hypothetical protein
MFPWWFFKNSKNSLKGYPHILWLFLFPCFHLKEDLLKFNVKKLEWYNNNTCKHKKNKTLFFSFEHLLLSYNKSIRIDFWRWKGKQFNLPHCSRFLKVVNWLMVEYEKKKKVLYYFIRVLKNLKMHW